MPLAHELTAEEQAAYRTAARRRQARTEAELARRTTRGWALAHQAAQLLRTGFGATRVVVFGSLTRPGLFTQCSDVDLAAWGLRPVDTLVALGAVMDLSDEITLNLVDIGTARSALRTSIELEGVDL